MWFILAIGSSIFAALTTILAKVGIDGVNSHLATAIRTFVVLAMSWGMVFLTNAHAGILEISRRSWVFLVLSGLATGASWLCYYKALQLAPASRVVPIDKLSVVITLVLAAILLREELTVKSVIGCVLIGAGTLMMVTS
jgi:transporter family protein